MAAVVTTKVIYDGPYEHVVHLTNVSDATDEAAVKKVDITAIAKNSNGNQPTFLNIERVKFALSVFKYVQLFWSHTANETALLLPPGVGDIDFSIRDSFGPNSNVLARFLGLKDGLGAGGDGSILLSTNGGAVGAVYDITLFLRKAQN